MDRDGTKIGYDLELTRSIADAVRVPVIASGGVGSLDDLVAGVKEGHATAVLAASIFHFGTYSIGEAKRYMPITALPCVWIEKGYRPMFFPLRSRTHRGANGPRHREESWTAKLVLPVAGKSRQETRRRGDRTVIAAMVQDRKNLTAEAADLLYHLIVVLKIADLPLQDVLNELERRTGHPDCRRRRAASPHDDRQSARRIRQPARTFEGHELFPLLPVQFEEWAKFRADTPLTLTADEVQRLRSLHDPIDLDEVRRIYLSLSRLLSAHVKLRNCCSSSATGS